MFDTQIVIWLETDRARLPARAAALVADGANDLAFSVVNIWEAVIKAARGRPDFAVDPVALRAALLEDEVAELPVPAHHVLGVTALAPIHRDRSIGSSLPRPAPKVAACSPPTGYLINMVIGWRWLGCEPING